MSLLNQRGDHEPWEWWHTAIVFLPITLLLIPLFAVGLIALFVLLFILEWKSS